ncbi:MAG: hypothetical protein EBR82_74310, partial [Caulobacteraceae bacterium]|nr:hypothetical protein [Caulobacteraceae bacterium]
MPWPVHPTGFFGARGDSDTYRIERSLRFNSADSAYLNRTFSTGNRKTWTWSGWVKRGKLGTTQSLFARYTANTESGLLTLAFWNDDTLRLAAGVTDHRISTAKYRDCSSWYHVVCAIDTTQATANNRIKLYINGSEITSFTSTSNYIQNTDTQVNENVAHYIGYYLASVEFDGYITEINFIDGQALTPSSFGQTDPITGRWKAKAYSGTYGTNGFYLKFADNSGTTATTLGKDSSGNGNNWTPNNFSVTAGTGNDSLVDSPTNYGSDSYSTSIDNSRGNYCTLNPINASSVFSFVNGNLDFSATATSTATYYIHGSLGVSYGKWYWEVTPSNVGTGPNITIGIRSALVSTLTAAQGIFGDGFGYNASGSKWDNSGDTSYGASWTNNDVIGVTLNLDSGAIEFYKNGVSQGTAFTGISGTFVPSITIGVSGVSRTIAGSINFGQRPFAYTAPTGFKALCTQNLTQPTIQKPSTAMDVVTYTGTGSSQSISSLGFS